MTGVQTVRLNVSDKVPLSSYLNEVKGCDICLFVG